MKISKISENKFLFTIDKDVTGKMVEVLKSKIESVISKDVEIYLNMQNVNFVVSYFVDAIVELDKKIREIGGKLIIKNCNDNIVNLFKTIAGDKEIIINEDK